MEAKDSPQASTVLTDTWERIERTTIDVGIMERATNAAVVSCDLGWNDVGSWASLYEILAHDSNDNVILGSGEHLAIDACGCLIHSSKRLVVCLGVQDLVVVDTEDALLVLPRDRAQQVSDIVKLLQQNEQNRYL
jgi:mannose-1-phosphate guanylyltransferase